MQRDESVRDGEPWSDLDRQLCSIAERRGALDQEELTLIREAVRVQLWRPLGMTSMREYLERRMGYGPQIAAERLRVAAALDALPEIDEALARNDLGYSAVREITRIATPKTAGAWVAACRGKVLREVEEMVAERDVGDAPESRPRPDLRRKMFRADLRPDVDALVRQARQILEAERGEKLDNDELMQALAARVLEPAAPSGKAPRPRHQIAVTVCKVCKQGWQNGAGREVPIAALELEVALCDAQCMSLEHAPGKLTQTIPAAMRRAVWRRDHGRCRIPGCRALSFIDAHHLLPLACGGRHEMENLALLCAGHHRALHAGLIVIEGSAPDFEVIRLSEVPHVGEPAGSVHWKDDASPPEDVVEEDAVSMSNPVPHVGELGRVAADVEAGLVRLGFRRAEAREAVARARQACDARTDPETCPKPTG
jgi:5-methylcytosine-specific restriction endonuclease McrA